MLKTTCAIGFLATACAYAAPAPPGPLRGPGIQASGGFHFSIDPVQLEDRQQGIRWTGNAGGIGGLPFPPHRLGLRVSGAHWFDLGGDIASRDLGADVRVGASAQLTELPWAVSIGGRSGKWGPYREQELSRQTDELRARVELYPTISQTENSALRGMFSAGVSHGQRWGQLDTGERDNFTTVGPNFVFEDTRFEAALGLASEKRFGGFHYGLLPYFSFGSDLVRCDGCSTNMSDIDQDFGVVLFFQGWFFLSLSAEGLERLK